jgi:BlaI family transcriptional regulator, penicillinase repressor
MNPHPPKNSPAAKPLSPPPAISDAEWVVMKAVWDKEVATANQVVEALSDRMAWKPKTIHTLLRRLVQKGALAYDKKGREFHYRPLVDAVHCVHAASRSFLDRFFGGRVAPFLACLLEKEKLSRNELEELRRILNEKAS